MRLHRNSTYQSWAVIRGWGATNGRRRRLGNLPLQGCKCRADDTRTHLSQILGRCWAFENLFHPGSSTLIRLSTALIEIEALVRYNASIAALLERCFSNSKGCEHPLAALFNLENLSYREWLILKCICDIIGLKVRRDVSLKCKREIPVRIILTFCT